MKLSEAIRLGAMLRSQAYGRYFDHDISLGSCAMGAALEACGYKLVTGATAMTEVLWPWTRDVQMHCPLDCERRNHDYPLMNDCARAVITHLNDYHRWTREAIADWVATIESERQPADASATSTNAVREDCESPVLTTRA